MIASRAPWTIHALSTAVVQALAYTDYEGAENGQVTAVPNLRTIRYYTTLGLLDRPGAFEGRTAFYGARHLLQLVAIKQLQERGLPLVEVQQQLAGLTDGALEQLAAVAPKTLRRLLDQDEVTTETAPAATSSHRAEQFWATPPVLSDDDHDAVQRTQTAPDDDDTSSSSFRGLSIGDQLVVMIKGAEPLSEDDEKAIRDAAGPLLDVLKTRGILRTTKGNV